MIRHVYGRFTNRPSRTPSSIPNLPLHGGKLSSSSSSPDSDSDHWYVFDPTSPEGWGTSQEWTRYSEAIATQAQYGRAARILSGNGLSPYDVVTALPGWDPLLPYGTPVKLGDVLNESAAYQSGPELWMTSGSLTGWLGRGEKDTYRISKSLTGAKAVRVRALPNDGAYLVPKLCVGSASADRLRAALQQVPGTAFAAPSRRKSLAPPSPHRLHRAFACCTAFAAPAFRAPAAPAFRVPAHRVPGLPAFLSSTACYRFTPRTALASWLSSSAPARAAPRSKSTIPTRAMWPATSGSVAAP